MKFLNNIYSVANNLANVAVGLTHLSASVANLTQGVSEVALGTVTSGLNGAIYLGARAHTILCYKQNRVVPLTESEKYAAELNEQKQSLKEQWDLFQKSAGTVVSGCSQVYSALGQSFHGMQLTARGASGLATDSFSAVKSGCVLVSSSAEFLKSRYNQAFGGSKKLSGAVEICRPVSMLGFSS